LYFFHFFVAFSDKLEFEIPPGEEQCFLDFFQKSDEVHGHYLVSHGGNLDVEVKIEGPDNHILNIQFEKNQKRQFLEISAKAEKNGIHSICFSNKMSRWAKKRVIFRSDELRSHAKEMATEMIDQSDVKGLTTILHSLTNQVSKVHDELFEFGEEKHLHTEMIINNENRLNYMGMIECFITIGLVIYQIRTVRSWFGKVGVERHV